MGSRMRMGRVALALAVALGMPAALAATPALAATGPAIEPPPTNAAPAPGSPAPAPGGEAWSIDSWSTSLEFAAGRDGGLEARFTESVLLSDPEATLGGGFDHSLLLAAHPGFADPLDRLVDVRATALDGDREIDVDTEVHLVDLGGGVVEAVISVLDERGGLDRAEYRLRYAVLEPFVPADPAGDAVLELGVLTFGPATHPLPIGQYRANINWGHIEPAELECAVVHQVGAQECVLAGDPLMPAEVRADGRLGPDAHIELLVILDPAADQPVQPQPEREAPVDGDDGPAPGDVADSTGVSLDAPRWTAFAAGGGLAAMGAVALVLARRSRAAEAPAG